MHLGEGGSSACVTCGPSMPFGKCAVFLEHSLQMLHTAGQGQWHPWLLPTPAFTAADASVARPGVTGTPSVGLRQEQLALGTRVLFAVICPTDGWGHGKEHPQYPVSLCKRQFAKQTVQPDATSRACVCTPARVITPRICASKEL